MTTDAVPAYVKRYLKLANLPARFHGWTWDDLTNYKSADLETAKDYVAAVVGGSVIRAMGSPACGRGLLLTGKPGHGKTALACVTLQEILRQAPLELFTKVRDIPLSPGYFAGYPEMLRLQQLAWKQDDGPEAEKVARIYGDHKAPYYIFVLDDLGKEHRAASHWAENVFDHVLRRRYDLGLPTIITSNVPLKDWGGIYGEAMESFAHEALAHQVILSPRGDRRKDL